MNTSKKILQSTVLIAAMLLACRLYAQPGARQNPDFKKTVQALAPDADVLKVAMDAPLTRFNRHLKGGAHTWHSSQNGWQLPLTLAALAGDENAEKKWLEQLRFSLMPENCLTASGGYPAQHELHLAGMYTLAKLDTAFWNSKLSADQRAKVDLLMKAAVVASAYTTADASYANGERATTLAGNKNLARGWNPNFREGMFGMLLAGTVYFGGTEEVNNILDSYDHGSFVKELKDAGLMNTHETFTWSSTHPESGAPSPEKITAQIRNYRYREQPLMDPMDQYLALTSHTYGAKVNCGLNNGKGIMVNGVASGIIASGCDDLPNKGKEGMLYEFDAVDGSGKRSSITYALSGFKPNLVNHALVVVGGYWREGPEAREIVSRLDVGITDLRYKLEKGYVNYANGKGGGAPFTLEAKNWNWSFQTLLPWWENRLKPFHGM